MQTIRWLAVLGVFAFGLMGQAPREVMFRLVKIDGPVHDPAKHTYWHGPFAECSSTLDINGDGKPDIAAGRNYYIAPYWQKFADYRDGAETNGPDVDDNFEGTMDVDGDGRMDVISSGWMRRQGIWWYRNPGKVGVKWESFPIHQADGLEGMVIGNIAGRGDKDLLVNYFAKKAGRGLVWMEHIDQAPWFKEHRIGPDNVGVSHGSGLGDMNGDGRLDAVTTTGWFEAPPNPAAGQWTWHPDWDFGGGAGLPILITDVNADGRNDLILGSDHGYGLAWYEQKMDGGKRTFVKHMIETDFPTFHTMALADLTGDGKPELITGKQLLAHNGGDVGALEPSFVFYYDIDGGKFRRHILSWTNLEPLFRAAGHAPPPTNVIGVGMRLSVEDLDQDGRQDVVIACRSGLYVFFNQGYSKKTRGINPLPDRNMYPDHRGWYTERAPVKDADGFVTLFDGKSLAGWQPTTNWAVEDGALVLKDRTDRREHNDNYLWTPRSYGDFVLELEFKVAEGTNSGIFVRTASPLDPVQTGIEVQIAAPRAGSSPSKNSVGGLYDMVAASSPDVKVGEWNKCRVTARGAKLSVEMNGKVVSEADLDQWTTARKNPDGTPNKFVMALKDYPRVGFIGLQDHGTPVWYRNIRIREIEK